MPRTGLFIFFGQSFTGGPRVVVNLATGLSRLGQTIHVFTNRTSEMTEALSRHGVPWTVCPAPRAFAPTGGRFVRRWPLTPLYPVLLIAYWLRIARALKQADIEVLWCRNIKGVLLAGIPARLTGRRLVWDLGMEYPSRGVVYFLHLIGFCVAHSVVAEGESVFRQTFTPWQRRAFGSKMIVNQSAIPDDRRLAIEASVLNASRNGADISTSSNRLRILYPASVQPRKNQQLLIDALHLLHDSHPGILAGIEILFAGPITDDEYHQQLLDSLEALQSQVDVRFLGWRNDMPQLLADAELFCLVSKNEGVPYVLLEAMHASLPPIVSKAGGMGDVIVHEKSGIVLQTYTARELADQLLRLIEDPALRGTLGANAKQYVSQVHTQAGWLERYTALFR